MPCAASRAPKGSATAATASTPGRDHQSGKGRGAARKCRSVAISPSARDFHGKREIAVNSR